MLGMMVSNGQVSVTTAEPNWFAMPPVNGLCATAQTLDAMVQSRWLGALVLLVTHPPEIHYGSILSN
jgi:hypothetical protein